MARKPTKKSKGLGKKVLEDEEVPDRSTTNNLFPVDIARKPGGGCLFNGTELNGETFCPNAEYCSTQNDELTEFRCLMRERFVYERILSGITTMPIDYNARQRK
jgi:hypothetical protein